MRDPRVLVTDRIDSPVVQKNRIVLDFGGVIKGGRIWAAKILRLFGRGVRRCKGSRECVFSVYHTDTIRRYSGRETWVCLSEVAH